ncbi:hypothetical protein SESBI_50730, partial [Sesbania bispinosa]
ELMESTKENHEHTSHEIDNNDTNVGDFEANGGQEPYIGMEFESQENGLSMTSSKTTIMSFFHHMHTIFLAIEASIKLKSIVLKLCNMLE